MGLIDTVQEMVLRDVMQERQARHIASLREKLSVEDLNEEALAALELMYCTGWMDCIHEMKSLRGAQWN